MYLYDGVHAVYRSILIATEERYLPINVYRKRGGDPYLLIYKERKIPYLLSYVDTGKYDTQACTLTRQYYGSPRKAILMPVSLSTL